MTRASSRSASATRAAHACGAARGPAGQDHDPLRPASSIARMPSIVSGAAPAATRGVERRDVRGRQWRRQRPLPAARHPARHKSAPAGPFGDPEGAGHRFAGGLGAARLVVPLGVAAHDRALVAGGVDPVDPRPALGGIDRTGGADHQHRHAIAPGIEHGHRRVEQADVGMDGGCHRATGHLGVAVRDGDGRLLVQAEQELRPLVAEIVDEEVVQSAEARAGIDGDVGDIERTQRLGDRVAAEPGLGQTWRQRSFAREPTAHGPWRGCNFAFWLVGAQAAILPDRFDAQLRRLPVTAGTVGSNGTL